MSVHTIAIGSIVLELSFKDIALRVAVLPTALCFV
jgi:hypothetical protein